jgi:DNA-binding phage protein
MDVEKAARAAIRKRERGQQLIDEGNAELARVMAAVRAGDTPVTRIAKVTGLSREYLYRIQREHEEAS